MPRKVLPRLVLSMGLVVLSAHCGGPAITSFQITPVPGGRPTGTITTSGLLEICSGEPVAVRWETKGETAMVLRLGDPRFASLEEEDKPDPLAPDTLEVTLVAGPPSKEVVRTTFVLQFPPTSRTIIALATELHGDTLVAAGHRGENIDEHFTVGEITNPLERILRVSHNDRSDELDGGGVSDAFVGSLLGGVWEFRSLMTNEERENRGRRPTSFRIEARIHCRPIS